MLPDSRTSNFPARVLSAATFLTVLCASGVGAQQEPINSSFRWIPSGLRVGLVGGYLSTSRGSLDFGLGSSAVVGGRVRARISSPISIELGTLYGSSRRLVIDPRIETGPAPVDTVNSSWILAHLGLQLALTGARTWHGLQPYALFGFGLMIGVDEEKSELLSDPALEDLRFNLGTAPLFQAGFGTEYRVSDRIGISMELRDFLTRLKSPDGFFDTEILDIIEEAGATAPVDTQWPNNLELSISLWYYL